MTTISTLYDQIQAVCTAALPTYREMPFPYLVDRNPIPLLEKAWGIVIGPAERSSFDPMLGCEQRILERSFSIPLVNQAGYLAGDTAGVEGGVKAILEDSFTLYSAFEQPAALSSAIKVDYLADSGIDFGLINGGTFAAIILDFRVMYQEGI